MPGTYDWYSQLLKEIDMAKENNIVIIAGYTAIEPATQNFDKRWRSSSRASKSRPTA